MLGSQLNRSLLNPKFDGYFLDPLDQERLVAHYPLEYKPTQATVSGRTPLSFQDIQSRIRHNHISPVPGRNEAIYVDSDLRVVLIEISRESLIPSFRIIFEIQKPLQTCQSDEYQREYPTALCLTSDVLFVSDGHGMLYLLRILRSEAAAPAELHGVYELPPLLDVPASASAPPFQIHSAAQVSEDAAIVLLSIRHRTVSEGDGTQPSISASRRLSSISFEVLAARFAFPLQAAPEREKVVSMDIVWRRRGTDVPLYTALDRASGAFLLMGYSPFRAIGVPTDVPPYEPSPDELAPVPRQNEALDAEPQQPQKPPPYAWTQTADELTLAFPLPSATPKSDIHVLFSAQTLTVLVRGSGDSDVPLPRYSAVRLWGTITPSSSFWTWDAQGSSACGLLMLHLEKQHEGTRWPQMFEPGPAPPELDVPETLDPSELHHIREALEKYTAALRDGRDASGLGLGTGVPSLAEGEIDEDADAAVGSSVCCTWVHAADGGTPAWVTPSTETPATVISTPLPGLGDDGISVTIKNSVDGLLYVLRHDGDTITDADSRAPSWMHTATWSALAFVLASKRDARFVYHLPRRCVLAFESGSTNYGGNLYVYREARPGANKAKQAILKIGSASSGPMIGVCASQIGVDGEKSRKEVILCLCENELIVLHDIL